MGRAEPGSFGGLLRRYRTATGLTQEELAERAGLSVRGVQDLERGIRRMPHPDTTRRLAEALGLGQGERAELLGAADRAGSSSGSATMARPLPTGTVTFLFTDVEGSTRNWEDHPDAMRVALARHDELIETLVARHDGAVVRPRGEGDSRFAVFARASEAVAAALAIQRALHAEPWPAALTLRVHVAVHTGEADLRAGDYYGPAVNRCARLRGVAYGGQTLLSQATCDLARVSLPADAGLRDLGWHRLPDLAEPEHVYQLTHPDLPSEFPPLKSLEARSHNLPIQVTSFIGREAELAEIQRLLGRTRLLTLTGAGGIGKTRLALETARRLAGDYTDGVWLVELAPLADAKLVVQTIATTLAIPTVGRPPGEALTEYLRRRQVLLILDNCEHVIDACAQIVDELLRDCGHVRLLATSREALRVPGEALWRVASLSVADPNALARADADAVAELLEAEAARLFVDRARLVVPSFAVTGHTAHAVARICRRLDGIPLAIELAAARLAALGVEQLAGRLDQRFGLLTGGQRTRPRRQETLRATIAWSHELLSDEEPNLLRRLAVFAGGWSLEAAEAVAAGPLPLSEEVVDLLGRLVAKSMVQVEEPPTAEPGTVRYRFLETIRQFAEEQLLASGEAEVVHERHRDWYLGLAEAALDGMEGPEQKRWLDHLDLEHDNLLAALAWSAADLARARELLRLAGLLGPYWQARGLLVREGIGWLELAVARSDALPSADRARALNWLGQLQSVTGNFARVQPLLEESIRQARAAGDRRLLSNGLSHLGQNMLSAGHHAEARGLLEEALAVSRSAGLAREVASNLSWLGVALTAVGRHEAAEALLLESIALGRQAGDNIPVVWSLRALGELYRARRDLARGRSAAGEALAIARRIDANLWLVSLLLLTLGDLAAADENWTTARDWYRQGLELADRTAPVVLAETLRRYAASCVARGDYDRAARYYGTASNVATTAWALVYAPPAREEDVVASTRQALGEDRFAAAWAEGAALTLEQTIAEILREDLQLHSEPARRQDNDASVRGANRADAATKHPPWSRSDAGARGS